MDATATITPSEPAGGASPRPRASTQPSSPVSAMLGLVVGGLLLWMGTPQLVAASIALNADAALQRVRSGSPGSPDQLARAHRAA